MCRASLRKRWSLLQLPSLSRRATNTSLCRRTNKYQLSLTDWIYICPDYPPTISVHLQHSESQLAQVKRFVASSPPAMSRPPPVIKARVRLHNKVRLQSPHKLILSLSNRSHFDFFHYAGSRSANRYTRIVRAYAGHDAAHSEPPLAPRCGPWRLAALAWGHRRSNWHPGISSLKSS